MRKKEGAVKFFADAPPADSEEEGIAQPVDVNGEDPTNDPSAEFGGQPYETQGPENLGEDDSEERGGREGFIPRDRFDRVNDRVHELEEALRREREMHHNVHRALAAGYDDLHQFEGDDAWARGHGYEGIEHYREHEHGDREVGRHLEHGGLSDAVRADLARDRQERLHLHHQLRHTRGLLHTVQQATLDHVLHTEKANFDGIEPEHWARVEKLCREAGHPIVAQHILATFAPIVKASRKSAAEKAVIEHNAKRSTHAVDVSPDGRGGGKAPSPGGKVDPKQAKGMLLSDLLGFRKSFG